MIFSPNVWGYFYIIQLLLLSLALGSWAVHQPRWLMVPRLSRFLIGFCITPFVLGVWMLFLATILPGAPKWLFLLPPPALAFILLGLYGPRTLRRLSRNYQRIWQASKNPWPAYLIYLGAALILALVIHKLLLHGQPPMTAHDASEYLAEALPFVQERSLSATTGFRDWPDGTIRGSVHNFLWPAFLSHALMTTGNNPPGYPYDHATRSAFQVTFIYMLLSVVALAGTTKRTGVGALALILLLQVPHFEYISTGGSRDAFRIIPLMLLATTLIGVSPPRLKLKLRPMSLLPPLILAAFCLSGHTLGGVISVVIVLAWLIWSIIHKARWLNLLLVLGAIGMGLLFGGFHYIEAYLETGNFRGTSRSIISLAGISPNEVILPERHRIAAEATMTQRLGILLERDRYRLSVPGVLGAIFTITWWTKLRQQRHSRFIPFIGLIVLTVSLPFIGLLDYKNYELSKWFISNYRYGLHWYPFAAVCVATVAWYWYSQFMSRGNRYIRSWANVAIVLLVSVATFSASQTIILEWPTESINDREKGVFENLDPLKTAVQQLPAGKRLLLDNSRYNYYLGNRAVLMYSRPTWEVIQAKNKEEVQDALNTLNIGAVALSEADISGWWDRIPLFSFLNSPENAFIAYRSNRLRLYIVDETLVRQHNRAVERARAQARVYLTEALTYYQQGQLQESIAAYEKAKALLPEAIEILPEAEQQSLALLLTKNIMQDALLDSSSASIVTEGETTYIVFGTEQKVKLEGELQVADGPRDGSWALVVQDQTRLNGPPSALKLSQGSLSVWGRLMDPAKKYSDLVVVNSNNLYIFRKGEDRKFIVYYNDVRLGAASVPITDDQWHHYVFTWQDNEQKFYIDGSLALVAKVPASAADTELFAIGWLGNRDGEQWGGLLADLITFDHPLSSDEIKALYLVGSSTDN